MKAKLEVVDVSSLNVPDRIIMSALPASPRCTPGSPRPMPTGLAYAASAPPSSMPSVDHFEPVHAGAQRYRRPVIPEPSELA